MFLLMLLLVLMMLVLLLLLLMKRLNGGDNDNDDSKNLARARLEMSLHTPITIAATYLTLFGYFYFVHIFKIFTHFKIDFISNDKTQI